MYSKLFMVLLFFQALLAGPSIAHPTLEFTTSQGLSWSDDFQDGNFDDWLTNGETIPGNFTIMDGALFAQEVSWNLAFHDSEVVTGTWSMDIYAVDREHHEILVPFILENYTKQDIWKNGYIVQLLTGPYRTLEDDGVTLLRVTIYPDGLFWFQYEPTGELNGWQHLDITRGSNGQMCVYLNGTLYINTLDNAITESTLFGFCGREGHGFDNVTVTNNIITIDKAPPIWIGGAPGNVSIQENDPLTYELNATDTSGIDSFWVNDTVRFTIDTEGILTNKTALDIGSYGIQVSVSDTNGYTLSSSFYVIVSAPESIPVPTEWIFIGIVGIIGVIAIVVVIRLRKV